MRIQYGGHTVERDCMRHSYGGYIDTVFIPSNAKFIRLYAIFIWIQYGSMQVSYGGHTVVCDTHTVVYDTNTVQHVLSY